MSNPTDVPPLTIVGQAIANGDLFVLLEDSHGQYVFTQRLDDADQWAVFSECMVGSITAQEVYEAANNYLIATDRTTTSPSPAPHSLADCIARVANVEGLEREAYGTPDKGEVARQIAQRVINEFQGRMLMPGYTHELFYKRRLASIIEAELS